MSHTAAPDQAYTHAIDQLYALGQELAPAPPLPDGTPAPRRKWDLAHMRTLCAALAQDGVAPQDTFPSVLIAGTNGKGSTASTLASILSAAGYKTGLYTSPHLSRVNERIQLLPPATANEAVILSAARSAESKEPERLDIAPTAQTFQPQTSGFSSQEPQLRAPFIAPLSHAMSGSATRTAATTEIPDQTFARLFSRVDDTAARLISEGNLPHHPSFFEVLTALAFLYFAEEKVDIAILEVGLGGRLDATNIVEPLLSVITDIALDHQEYLGNTIAEITREKAGILRANGTLITLPQHPEANQAIGEAAALLNLHAISAADFIPSQLPSSARSAAEDKSVVILSEAKDPERLQATTTARTFQPQIVSSLPRNHYTVTLDNQPLTVDSPLSGHHQQRNIALAIAAANALRNLNSYKPEISNQISYKITNAAIEAGIRNTSWPGRLEFLPPNLLLDVAHNPAGAWTLRAAIARLPEDQPRTLLFSCLSDKDLTEMSRILFPLFDSSQGEGREKDHIVLAPIANPRAAKVEDLLAAAHALEIPAHAAPHLEAALAQARAITPPSGLIIATGSVYLVGAIRDLALQEPEQN
jgi:dihydrofolate synthase/folylpolyglutamate synthase